MLHVLKRTPMAVQWKVGPAGRWEVCGTLKTTQAGFFQAVGFFSAARSFRNRRIVPLTCSVSLLLLQVRVDKGSGACRGLGAAGRTTLLEPHPRRLCHRRQQNLLQLHRGLWSGSTDLGRREPGAGLPDVAVRRHCGDTTLFQSGARLQAATLLSRQRLATSLAEKPYAHRGYLDGRSLQKVLLLFHQGLWTAKGELHRRRGGFFE